MRNIQFILILSLISIAFCGRDFYRILEVGRDASEEEIKKAFRRLSVQYHPDKNPGDEKTARKYVEINNAYEVLTDIEKKIIYDRSGEEGLNNQYDVDIFGNRKSKRGGDSRLELKVTLEELYNGGIKQVGIQRNIICNRCKGTGSKDGKIKQCQHCQGRGQVMQNMQMGIGFNVQMQVPCPHCQGKGQMQTANCPSCSGQKTVKGEKSFNVFIEKGMPENHEIRYDKQGEQHPELIPGDLVFLIRQIKHQTFTRNGNDLNTNLQISLQESILGFKRQIQHLDSHSTQVEVKNQITQPFKIIKIKGEGMPIHQESSNKGDLDVKIIVNLPKMITDEGKAILKKIFALNKK